MNRGPFDPRGVLALVLFGAIVFLALLYALGAGMTGGSGNDGGGHAEGKGLNGYAALSRYLEARGIEVQRSRTRTGYRTEGLLVLTPPHGAEGAEIERIVRDRRYIGPTLVIAPKWLAGQVPTGTPGAKRGWVRLAGAETPEWPGFLDDVSVEIRGSPSVGWRAAGLEGGLPLPRTVLSGSGERLVPLVVARGDARVLAAYVEDGGDYPALEALSLQPSNRSPEDEDIHPIILVFEPDLLDNYGFTLPANARLAETLFEAAGEFTDGTVTFDLTLNGLARSANLLTLAFTPPFLAATLCLLIAAVAAGWRAFNRFGPAYTGARAIAFGKRALVSNAAGLIRRSGRLRLVAAPFADAARERLARALGLPRHADAATTEAAIDRALAVRAPDAPPFSLAAEELRSARRPPDMLRAAQALHALERTLTR